MFDSADPDFYIGHVDIIRSMLTSSSTHKQDEILVNISNEDVYLIISFHHGRSFVEFLYPDVVCSQISGVVASKQETMVNGPITTLATLN